ncbi:hypothetical protein OFN22_29995, partial [Escherichia coli]|nr:hypothetical protein [Escherichia coli]
MLLYPYTLNLTLPAVLTLIVRSSPSASESGNRIFAQPPLVVVSSWSAATYPSPKLTRQFTTS